MNIGYPLFFLTMSAAMAVSFGQQAQQPPPQQQNPPAADQRTQPGPNGTKVGPPLNQPAPAEQRTTEQTQPNAPNAAAVQEAVRNFLALGAPPDPEAVKRGQAIFVPT